VVRALPRVRRERKAIQSGAVAGADAFAAPLSGGLDSPYFGAIGRSRAVNAILHGLWQAIRRVAGVR
jgi:hypothetical protein